MSFNYTTYHLHSDYSLLDSCTNFKEYIDAAVQNGQKAIAFTEHGKPMGWVSKSSTATRWASNSSMAWKST